MNYHVEFALRETTLNLRKMKFELKNHSTLEQAIKVWWRSQSLRCMERSWTLSEERPCKGGRAWEAYQVAQLNGPQNVRSWTREQISSWNGWCPIKFRKKGGAIVRVGGVEEDRRLEENV